MTLATPFPIQVAGKTFGEDVMYRLLDDLLSVGVVGANDLQVIQNPAGANRSVTVAPGEAYVALTSGGKRQVYNDVNSNSGAGVANATDWISTFAAADGVNPRVDRVVLTVRDSAIDATGAYDAKFRVVTGTPSAGATLVNLTGAAAIPANSILLANVLSPAGAATIVTANIDTTVRARASAGSGNAALTIPAGMRVIADTTLAADAASIAFASIPQTYAHLYVVLYCRTDQAVASAGNYLRANSDNAANYDYVYIDVLNTTVSGHSSVAGSNGYCGAIPGNSAAANKFGGGYMLIPNYASTVNHKFWTWQSSEIDATAAATNYNFEAGHSLWRSAAAITRLDFSPNSFGSNYRAGTRIAIYGIG